MDCFPAGMGNENAENDTRIAPPQVGTGPCESMGGQAPAVSDHSGALASMDCVPVGKGKENGENGAAVLQDGSGEGDSQRRQGHRVSALDLQRHFSVSQGDAAKALGLSKSTLKRVCRKHGIQRWPFRQIRSITGKIEQVEAVLAELGDSGNTVAIAEHEAHLQLLQYQQEKVMSYALLKDMGDHPASIPAPLAKLSKGFVHLSLMKPGKAGMRAQATLAPRRRAGQGPAPRATAPVATLRPRLEFHALPMEPALQGSTLQAALDGRGSEPCFHVHHMHLPQSSAPMSFTTLQGEMQQTLASDGQPGTMQPAKRTLSNAGNIPHGDPVPISMFQHRPLTSSVVASSRPPAPLAGHFSAPSMASLLPRYSGMVESHGGSGGPGAAGASYIPHMSTAHFGNSAEYAPVQCSGGAPAAAASPGRWVVRPDNYVQWVGGDGHGCADEGETHVGTSVTSGDYPEHKYDHFDRVACAHALA